MFNWFKSQAKVDYTEEIRNSFIDEYEENVIEEDGGTIHVAKVCTPSNGSKRGMIFPGGIIFDPRQPCSPAKDCLVIDESYSYASASTTSLLHLHSSSVTDNTHVSLAAEDKEIVLSSISKSEKSDDSISLSSPNERSSYHCKIKDQSLPNSNCNGKDTSPPCPVCACPLLYQDWLNHKVPPFCTSCESYIVFEAFDDIERMNMLENLQDYLSNDDENEHNILKGGVKVLLNKPIDSGRGFDTRTITETNQVQEKEYEFHSIPFVSTEEEKNNLLASEKQKRHIAAKAIGTKVLKGYNITEFSCATCSMPVMNKDGTLLCVACDRIHKKAKELASQKRMEFLHQTCDPGISFEDCHDRYRIDEKLPHPITLNHQNKAHDDKPVIDDESSSYSIIDRFDVGDSIPSEQNSFHPNTLNHHDETQYEEPVVDDETNSNSSKLKMTLSSEDRLFHSLEEGYNTANYSDNISPSKNNHFYDKSERYGNNYNANKSNLPFAKDDMMKISATYSTQTVSSISSDEEVPKCDTMDTNIGGKVNSYDNMNDNIVKLNTGSLHEGLQVESTYESKTPLQTYISTLIQASPSSQKQVLQTFINNSSDNKKSSMKPTPDNFTSPIKNKTASYGIHRISNQHYSTSSHIDSYNDHNHHYDRTYSGNSYRMHREPSKLAQDLSDYHISSMKPTPENNFTSPIKNMNSNAIGSSGNPINMSRGMNETLNTFTHQNYEYDSAQIYNLNSYRTSSPDQSKFTKDLSDSVRSSMKPAPDNNFTSPIKNMNSHILDSHNKLIYSSPCDRQSISRLNTYTNQNDDHEGTQIHSLNSTRTSQHRLNLHQILSDSGSKRVSPSEDADFYSSLACQLRGDQDSQLGIAGAHPNYMEGSEEQSLCSKETLDELETESILVMKNISFTGSKNHNGRVSSANMEMKEIQVHDNKKDNHHSDNYVVSSVTNRKSIVFNSSDQKVKPECDSVVAPISKGSESQLVSRAFDPVNMKATPCTSNIKKSLKIAEELFDNLDGCFGTGERNEFNSKDRNSLSPSYIVNQNFFEDDESSNQKKHNLSVTICDHSIVKETGCTLEEIISPTVSVTTNDFSTGFFINIGEVNFKNMVDRNIKKEFEDCIFVDIGVIDFSSRREVKYYKEENKNMPILQRMTGTNYSRDMYHQKYPNDSSYNLSSPQSSSASSSDDFALLINSGNHQHNQRKELKYQTINYDSDGTDSVSLNSLNTLEDKFRRLKIRVKDNKSRNSNVGCPEITDELSRLLNRLANAAKEMEVLNATLSYETNN